MKDHRLTYISMTSEAVRSLPPDSRWFTCLSKLSSNASQNQTSLAFFQEHNIRRVQRLRGVVYNLFKKTEEKVKTKSHQPLLSDSAIMLSRVQHLETQMSSMSKIMESKFFALTTKMDSLIKSIGERHKSEGPSVECDDQLSARTSTEKPARGLARFASDLKLRHMDVAQAYGLSEPPPDRSSVQLTSDASIQVGIPNMSGPYEGVPVLGSIKEIPLPPPKLRALPPISRV